MTIKFKQNFWKILTFLFPKFDTVVIVENGKLESNAIEIANYIKSNYNKTIYFVTSESFKTYSKSLLLSGIKVVALRSFLANWARITSRFIFSTHGAYLSNCKSQISVNVWHGVFLKKIRKLRNEVGIDADITVATSDLSKKMFAECFGVPEDKVFISGYPRNDIMLRSFQNREEIKGKVNLTEYDKVVFWMPTFRRVAPDTPLTSRVGMQLGNPFEIDNFDISSFNDSLVKHNALCLLKPHYFYLTNRNFQSYSNIQMIDDEWICSRGITLYHLLSCADVLISDFSSVMLDYTLLDKPIICFCTDLKEYKVNQGIYFENIEDWVPSRLIEDQNDFFESLNRILEGADPDKDQRRKISKIFFKNNDVLSTKRLVEKVFTLQKS